MVFLTECYGRRFSYVHSAIINGSLVSWFTRNPNTYFSPMLVCDISWECPVVF